MFFSAVKFEIRSFQFYRRLQRVLFYTKVFVLCILDFVLYDVTQCEINNNNGGLRVQLPTLPISKVSKVAKIRNRYNQVPHLTQDTNGKVTNSQKTPQTRAKRSALSQQVTTKHIYCLKVFSRCICSRVSLVSLLLYIAAPPTFYQIFMNNGLFQKTKVEFHG